MVTSFKERREFYSVNLPNNEADIYRSFLKENNFYFEASEYFGEYTHFEIYLNSEEYLQAESFLSFAFI